MVAPDILALDFDGVLCDGLLEYFETSWRAYCQLFQPEEVTPPPGLAQRFYPLRPVIETGWEMPMVLYALLHGIEDGEILEHWRDLVPDLLQKTGLTWSEVMATVDGLRDRWIQTDPDSWLDLQRFYPGVVERVQGAMAAGVYTVIISTKEGRFIAAMLQRAGVDFPRDRIFGKEVQQPKTETLRQVIAAARDRGQDPTVWFIEDRYQTLQKVKAQPDLAGVTLLLGDWGYNTAAEREAARRDDRIHLLSLAQLVQEFDTWLSPG